MIHIHPLMEDYIKIGVSIKMLLVSTSSSSAANLWKMHHKHVFINYYRRHLVDIVFYQLQAERNVLFSESSCIILGGPSLVFLLVFLFR